MPLSHTRDTIGVLARSVSDIALLHAVVSGNGVPRPANLKGLRIGLPVTRFWENLDHGLKAVMDRATCLLVHAGVDFVVEDLTDIGALVAQGSMPILLYEATRDLDAYLARVHQRLALPEVMEALRSPDVGALYALARDFPRAAYDQAMGEQRPQLQQLYANYFALHEVEAVLFPTTPLPAAPIDPHFTGAVQINGLDQPGGLLAQSLAYTRNTDPGSMAGLPGLSLPAGLTTAGLPVGLALDGPPGSELRLLAIGMAFENVLGSLPAPAMAPDMAPT